MTVTAAPLVIIIGGACSTVITRLNNNVQDVIVGLHYSVTELFSVNIHSLPGSLHR